MTQLEMIQERRSRFTWGRVIQIHKIGPYGVVEYIEKKLEFEAPARVLFHLYVNGRDTSHSFPSLDLALIGAVVFKQLGAGNMYTVPFIARGLELEME